MVYKFIGREFGVSALALRRLKVSRINELNDPFEFLAADLLDRRKRAAFYGWKEEMSRQYGIVCFSQGWGSPLLWGHYADNHSGFALGFDIPKDKLTEVVYKESRQKVEFPEDIQCMVGAEDMLKDLMRTKHEHWGYESESRIFLNLNDCHNEGGRHFILFSGEMRLRKVVLGMRCDFSVAAIKDLVRSKGDDVWVVKAGMAKRKFKVIEDKGVDD